MKYILPAILLAAVACYGETPVPDGFGINIHFTDPRPGEMKMIVDAGFKWVRMDLNWGGTEREKGKYDFRAYDRLMTALDEHGIRALFILDYANRHYDNGLSPHTDEGRAAFARWTAAAVEHFKGRNVLWEMWTEPNLKQSWKSEPNVTNYTALAIAVGKAIKTVAPREKYCGPAVCEINLKFLEACFQGGALEYWDAVTVHPYRGISPPETVLPEYAKLRILIDKYAPKGRRIPILSGEWGYSTVQKNIDDEKQGKYLSRQFLMNLLAGVPLSIWYDWHDDGTDPKDKEHHFGIVRHQFFKERDPVYDTKPAYATLQVLVANLRGYRFDKRIETGSPDDFVLLFRKNWQTKFAAWTVAAPHEAVVGGERMTLTGAVQYIEPKETPR